MTLKSVSRFLIDLVYPNRCGFCQRVIPWNKLICPECEEKLEYSPNPIRQGEKGSFAFCISPCKYSGVARRGVLNLKYHYGKNTAEYLIPCLSELIKTHIPEDIDLITFVPMTYWRKSEYGYNQAEVIADMLSKELDIPCDGKLLAKIKKMDTQHSLTSEERKRNAKSAYKPGTSKRDICGKTVLLADDIITTGATLSSCSRLLLERGAERVYCATLTHTEINRKE